ncbi:MAG TPA: M56 family metallopeptidase [Terriglobia bacterium]|nr:M56 family metallopeptidase [Terriglobia bacterium]
MTLSTLFSLFANHLWQSTLFALAAGVVVLFLRQHPARTRYWVWWVASVKFLVPLSLLVSVGSLFSWRITSEPAVQPFLPSAVIVQVTQPFTASPPAPAEVNSIPASDPESSGSTFPVVFVAVWLCGTGLMFMRWGIRWSRARSALRHSETRRVEILTEGRELSALRRLEGRLGMRKALPIVGARATVEPAVFGIVRPVLAWPVDLSERLEDQELEAILLHELTHQRRWDNLTAAVHMVVEAVFWFYPLVWWIGSRLLEEREKACDEAVLRLGGESRTYAEGILKVCEFCLESPLTCAAGVTGSDLKKRIEDIRRNGVTRQLGLGAAALLTASLAVPFVAPFAAGVLQAAQITAPPVIRAETIPVPPLLPEVVVEPQAPGPVAVALTPGREPKTAAPPVQTRDVFEVVSIRAATGARGGGGQRGGGPGQRNGGPAGPAPCAGMFQVNPGRFVATNVTLYRLITLAYGKHCRLSQEQELISGGPDWRQSVAFDIQATLPEGSPVYTQQQLNIGEAPKLQAMLQNMLADRFGLVLHRETKEIPVYNLVLVKMGRVQLSADQTPPPPPQPGGPLSPDQLPRGSFGVGVDPPAGRVTVWASAVPVSTIFNFFQGNVGRMVVDKTEQKGLLDIPQVTLDVGKFDVGPGAVTVWPEIMNQLGFRMDPARGPAEVLVIDRADKPSEN